MDSDTLPAAFLANLSAIAMFRTSTDGQRSHPEASGFCRGARRAVKRARISKANDSLLRWRADGFALLTSADYSDILTSPTVTARQGAKSDTVTRSRASVKMSNGVFSAGEADTAASRRIPAPSPAGSNTVDRNTPSPLYAKFAKSSPLPSPHTSDVQTGAETRPLLPAEPTAQHPVNSPQTKSLKSVGVDETKQETEIHLDRSHSRDP